MTPPLPLTLPRFGDAGLVAGGFAAGATRTCCFGTGGGFAAGATVARGATGACFGTGGAFLDAAAKEGGSDTALPFPFLGAFPLIFPFKCGAAETAGGGIEELPLGLPGAFPVPFGGVARGRPSLPPM